MPLQALKLSTHRHKVITYDSHLQLSALFLQSCLASVAVAHNIDSMKIARKVKLF